MIALVVAGCTGTGRNPPVAHRPAGAAHATAAPELAEGGASTAGPNGSTATPASGGAGSATAAAVEPGPMRVPRFGTYSARMTRNGSTQNLTIAVSRTGGSGAETDLATTTTTADGNQEVNSEAWKPGGIYLTETSYVVGGKRIDCAFQAPVLESKLPLAVGVQWSSSGTCTTPAPNASTTDVSISGEVTGTARQVIGGVGVATYVVKATLSTDTKGSYAPTANGIPQPAQPFEMKTDSQLTVYVDAAAGLDVHTITRSTSTAGGSTSSSTSDLLLTSVDPS